MYRKGFTLIELLAVIVILAIISLIAVPIVLNIVNDSNMESKKRSIDNYASALELALVEYQLDNNKSVYGSFQMVDGSLTNGDVTLDVKYDGQDVACDNVTVTQDGLVSLSSCSVDGQEIDYVHEMITNMTTLVDLSNNKTVGMYDNLQDALDVLKANNLTNVKIIVFGSHEIVASSSAEFGGSDTTNIVFVGGNSSAEIVVNRKGNLTNNKINAANANAIVTFDSITFDDTFAISTSTAWESAYTRYLGNFNFINCKFDFPIAPATAGKTYNFTNCLFNSNLNTKTYGIWIYSGDVTFEGCTFKGYRAIKIHDYTVQANVVINNNIFDSLTAKPGIVVGDVVAAGRVTVKITNNIFINANLPGDQGNYTYESDTMGPTEYSNNIVNGVVENSLRDTSSYDSWLASH
ncbi:MAG: type II secretion system protein [Bacilli bacterium]|nr:type II secretion system protein [Bacilli bacterium]